MAEGIHAMHCPEMDAPVVRRDANGRAYASSIRDDDLPDPDHPGPLPVRGGPAAEGSSSMTGSSTPDGPGPSTKMPAGRSRS